MIGYQKPMLLSIETPKNSKSRSMGSMPEFLLHAHVLKMMKNGQLPPNITVDSVCWKNLDNQNGKANETIRHVLPVVKACQIKGSGIMYPAEKEHAMKCVNIPS
ncbi:hypothetical protein G9A89_001337 [Geosiphon pyriformis]|nr:hypothetical protein G9A89_001337 [Geosiphon pyriformis]